MLVSACSSRGPGGEQADAENGDKSKKDENVQAMPVEVDAAALRAIAASYSGTANLEAPADAQVVAKTSGVLLQIYVEEGDQVKAGQALARIDPERARLEVARSEATMKRLENNYQRSKELFARKLVSVEAHDQLRYELDSAKAAYDLARLELSHTTITAPISGVIAQRMAKPGNLIQLNAPVYRIVDISRLEAVLNVPEREAATMRTGLPIEMVVDALPGKMYSGVVDRVSPVVDAGSGTVRVVAAFAPKKGELRPGMFGRLKVIYQQRDSVLTVPRVALLEEEGSEALFVVNGAGKDAKAERRKIVLGYINGEFAEVISGVTAGERVVTAGKVAIRDGAPVQVLGDVIVSESGDEAVSQATAE